MAKLTEKQKRFIDYYIETGNAAEAARRAGYKGKNLDVIGSQNLVKLRIYIEEKMKQKDNERIASQDEVLEFLTRVMRGLETEEVVVTENKGDYISEAKIIKKQVSAKDRVKAAELLGKRYALFTEKVNVSGNMGVVIVDDIEDDNNDGEN
ncbi:terminase small subunit [Carboxydothermus hydrogenoformans]|uniref:Prophage LambdaCh01, terminase, small subunit n=1 Tax=Carboxydothermus hydrogenoformans (strain ATCC BAA-161 / DSM 6008 / Z-2901) TaxID=246194 RepID=Q3ABI3_CARHZ|nr:terminase small subunit [Carboxydothermus hydrogenoformans]ABB15541.1 prophage LambdaCh01, terminase, small subunit [Carboxydothermus hydrogenoformans Z-2901]